MCVVALSCGLVACALVAICGPASAGAVTGWGLGASIGGLNPINPSSLPGLIFDYEPQSIVNSGGVVGTWTDLGPHANNLTSSGGSRPTYTASALAGYPGVTGVPASSTHLQSASSFTWGTTAGTIIMVASIPSQGSAAVVETTANASTNGGIGIDSGGSTYATISPSDDATWSLPTATFQVFTAVFDESGVTSTQAYWGRNRVGFGLPVGGSNFANGNLNVLAQGSASAPSGATIMALYGYTTLLTEPQKQGAVDYLSQRYSINTTLPTRALYVDGDSISSVYGTVTRGWVAHVAEDGSFDAEVTASNAYPGKTLQTGYANTWQLANIRAGLTKDAILWLGTNDFCSNGSLTVTTLYNSYLLPYVAELQAAGFRHVGVITMLPRGGVCSPYTAAQFEVIREGAGGWNPMIRSGATANGYSVIDVGGDATIGQAGDENNATYYQTDLVHLTDAGQLIVYSSYITPTLSAWH